MAFDFSAVEAPFRIQPGLRRLAAGVPQLTPSRPGDRALDEKLAVLTRDAPQALLVESGFDPGPALRALSAHAAAEHPDALAWDGASHWRATRLGWAVRGDEVDGDGPPALGACLRALPPHWRAAALLALAFAEDFAVLDGTTTRIAWLAVCLPSRWAPRDKIGRTVAEVHAPVADNRLLVAAGAALARLVTGADRWERFVWTVTPCPALDQHPDRRVAGGWGAHGEPDRIAAQAWFRTERQTFIPVADRAQAVFTIHVESDPLAVAIDSPARARRLHAALASMSAAVLAYRGLAEAREPLLAWLAARSHGDAVAARS